MAFQLTISRTNLPAAEALKRKHVIDIDAPNATIGGCGCDCVLPDTSETLATITQLADGSFEVTANSLIRVNGNAPTDNKMPLHSGDTLSTDEWSIQFHVRMETVPQSWRSAFLACFAKSAIVVIIMTVLCTMFWLPEFLRRNPRWARHATLEQLSLLLDSERRHVRQLEKKDHISTLNKLLLEEIRSELDNYVRHVRAYESSMTAEQHLKLLHQAQKLSMLLERIEQGKEFPPLPQPTIDQAVKNILSQ
ncbi:MAG: hypothetical protein J6X55_13040 [Victivallales bacterium]|nr:hypothetical protein [Victivallales bacterium]